MIYVNEKLVVCVLVGEVWNYFARNKILPRCIDVSLQHSVVISLQGALTFSDWWLSQWYDT